MITSAYAWTFSANASPPPQSKQMRLDEPLVPSSASRAWLSNIADNGDDVYVGLMAIPTGASMLAQDDNDHATYLKCTTTAAPIDRGGYVEIGIAVVEGGPLNNNQRVLVVFEAEPTAPPSGGTGPTLIALDVAKTHLRITDTAHDADVALKLAEAEATIVDYLKTRAPEWIGPPLDPVVESCMLAWLTHLYEDRGDPFSQFAQKVDLDAEAWSRIERALMRKRDPALA